MARYKVTYTIYKDPTGKTLKGPSFIHWLGDLCSGACLMGIILVILSFMEDFGTASIITGIVMAVAGLALGTVLHKKAKKDAEEAFLKALAQMESQPQKKD